MSEGSVGKVFKFLSTADVRKLKAANSLRFSYIDGTHLIVVEDGAGQQEIVVNGDLSATTVPGSHVVSCNMRDPWAKAGGAMKTAVDCMRSGDLVTLIWVTRYNRDLEIADLHRDELYLKIDGVRNGKQKEFMFMVEISVTRDDQYRMIKYDTTSDVLKLS